MPVLFPSKKQMLFLGSFHSKTSYLEGKLRFLYKNEMSGWKYFALFFQR